LFSGSETRVAVKRGWGQWWQGGGQRVGRDGHHRRRNEHGRHHRQARNSGL